MKIVKRGKELWITDCLPSIGDMGPYENTPTGREEAEQDLKGVARTIKSEKLDQPPK